MPIRRAPLIETPYTTTRATRERRLAPKGRRDGAITHGVLPIGILHKFGEKALREEFLRRWIELNSAPNHF
jgi:hypothetical protein